MTREEAWELSDAIGCDVIDKIYDSFEQRIKELEALLEAKECIKKSDEWEAHIQALDEKFEEQQIKLERDDV